MDLNNIEVSGLSLSYVHAFLFIEASEDSFLKVNNFSAHDSDINDGVAIIDFGNIATAQLENFSFWNIGSSVLSDSSNFLFHFDEVAATVDGLMTLSGVSITN